MNDLIDRQQAIDAAKHAWAKGLEPSQYIELLPPAQPERPEQPESAKEYCAECDHIEMCQWYPYEGCEFRSLPSAKPKHGEWICTDDFYETAECSCCKWDSGEPWDYATANFKFCPNCGADMRGEEDD